MARHIVEAGHVVTVASRSRPPIGAALGFCAEGAAAASVVGASDVTILCLPSSPDVVAVLDVAFPALGRERSGRHPPSTLTSGAAARPGPRDRSFLPRGPLSGGARRGRPATLMVGGEAEHHRGRFGTGSFRLVVHARPGMGSSRGNNLITPCRCSRRRSDHKAQQAGGDGAPLRDPHATGDCIAVRTGCRPRVRFRTPRPTSGPRGCDRPHGQGFDLAIDCAAQAGVPLFTSGIVRQILGSASAADGRGLRPWPVIRSLAMGGPHARSRNERDRGPLGRR